MTFATRDRYRHVVERIAKRTRLSEEETARQAVALAARSGTTARRPRPGAPTSATSWWTPGCRSWSGSPATTPAAPAPAPAGRAAPDSGVRRRHRVATVAALAAVLWLAGAEARGAWLLVLAFALLPAVDIAVTVVNQLLTTVLPPRTLPKLDLGDGGRGRSGIPESMRTAVVVPTLLTSVEQVQETLADLESQFLANRAANLHFAILSDFTDAAAETLPQDAAIVQAAAEGVRALNARYPVHRSRAGDDAPPPGDAFYLFHRPRRWNPRQGVWMGWERKRGKLGDFNRFVLTGADDAFSTIVGDTAPLRQVRYVITLDADTVLPPGAAALLVGAIAHPLNQAVWDPSAGASCAATASCSRAWACRSPARTTRRSPPSTPGTPAWTPTPPPCPTSTRTCSARGASPGRGSTTSACSRRPPAAAFPRTRSSRTTSSRGTTRAPGWSPTSPSTTTTPAAT
jgi:cyclic beta-1,2-glucan synthetase